MGRGIVVGVWSDLRVLVARGRERGEGVGHHVGVLRTRGSKKTDHPPRTQTPIEE